MSQQHGVVPTLLGVNWRSNFDRYLRLATPTSLSAERADGQVLNFAQNGATWTSDSDVDFQLTQAGSGVASTWTLTDQTDTVETYTTISASEAILTAIKARNGYTRTLQYDAGNRLTTVVDSFGRSLQFSYQNGLLQSVSTPDTLVLTYGYNSSGVTAGVNDRLISITYSGTPQTSQTYLYENSSFPFALTGITDENGARFTTWTYDSSGRATSSQHAGGADLTQVAYNADGTSTVTGPLGAQMIYTFAMLQGISKVTQINRLATATTAASRIITYDANGYMASQTDWNGNLTTYVNDTHGQPTSITEAMGKPQARVTTVTYATNFHLPAEIVTAGLTTDLVYDGSGNLLTKTLTDTTTSSVPYSTGGTKRTWTYTWANGLLSSVKGPRADVNQTTSFAYDWSGALVQTTNALGQATQITQHTGGGLPLTITDPNSVVTTLGYDSRLRLHTKVMAVAGGNIATTWDHDAVGNLTKLTQPDGTYLSYAYDNAHRLTSITNANGEAMPLTLDANGDVTQILWQTAAAVTTRSHMATFDALGRKMTDIGGVSQTTTYGYDSQGNRTSIQTPLTWATGQVFDALNRLQTITDPYTHTTGFTYDNYNRPLTVTDPNGHATTYVYDGFGETISVASPDSGTTVYHYDLDGNLSGKTDAAGQVTNWTYDALDRPLTRNYPADSTLNVAYTYDEVSQANGITRLTSVTDQVGSLSLGYDESGNVISKARTISGTVYTTSYSYNGQRTIGAITYPGSAWIATYARDAAGQVTGIATRQPGQAAVTLISGVTHLPFGPVASLTWGNGVTRATTFDADYRQTGLTDTATVAIQSLTYGYDADNNLHTITDAISAANSQTLGYDHLERLTSAVSGAGGYGTLGYTYDNNGNRTAAGSTSYTIAPTSNRLTAIGGASVGYFLTGNINSIGAATMTYNQANQLATASASGSSATYGYDAFGNRLTIQPPSLPLQVYSYDQAGNLLTETNNGIETDYIYLDGNPIAVVQPAAATISFIHADRLGTPQLATDASQASVWSTQYQPFGGGMPTGSITQNLKMPGQYGDSTGYFHNGFRDYNPAIGRYLESDPIGLAAGTNTYAYVGSNAQGRTDPTGLDWRKNILNLACIVGFCNPTMVSNANNAPDRIAISQGEHPGFDFANPNDMQPPIVEAPAPDSCPISRTGSQTGPPTSLSPDPTQNLSPIMQFLQNLPRILDPISPLILLPGMEDQMQQMPQRSGGGSTA